MQNCFTNRELSWLEFNRRVLLESAVIRAAEPEMEEDLFVTPRDIDRRVRDTARLVGYAVDLALQEGMTVADVDMFLS